MDRLKKDFSFYVTDVDEVNRWTSFVFLRNVYYDVID